LKSLANPMIMKEVNTDIVRKALRAEKQATKQRLSELTGLSTVTVGTILGLLISSKEVFESELVPSSGGRPAHNFCYNGEFSHVLIIYAHVCSDKDTIYCRVINLFGERIFEEKLSLVNIYLESFEPLIDRLMEKYPTIKAIGFGLPGVEYENVMVISDYEHLNGTYFSEHYQKKYGIPISIENDVNLAVLGYCHSHFDEDNSVVYIYFPQKYEPGAGIFIHKNLYKGMNNFAGEIMYLPVGTNWKTMDYSEFNKVCDVIAKLIISFTCILNPNKVIINGDFLTEGHLQSIKWNCQKTIKELFLPQIHLSEDFDLDYETGLNIRTLEMINLQKTLY